MLPAAIPPYTPLAVSQLWSLSRCREFDTHGTIAVPHLEHDADDRLASVDIEDLDLIGQWDTRLLFNYVLTDEFSAYVYTVPCEP
jgi:hypothetical protein